MEVKLRRSIERFSLLVPLVVREVGDRTYETIGGAQRLAVLCRLGYAMVPCVVTQADDGEAEAVKGLGIQHQADGIGMARSALANCLRLLNLPDVVLGPHRLRQTLASGGSRVPGVGER